MVWHILIPIVAAVAVGASVVGGILYFQSRSTNEQPPYSEDDWTRSLTSPKIKRSTCTICKQSISSKITTLACSHEYHEPCFLAYLSKCSEDLKPVIKCADPKCNFVLTKKSHGGGKLSSENSRKQKCSICKKLLTEEKLHLGMECKHLFHTQCFTRHLNLKNNGETVYCPAEACSLVISDDVLASFRERKCLLCDELMFSFNSLLLDCKHSFHRECLESNRIYKLVKMMSRGDRCQIFEEEKHCSLNSSLSSHSFHNNLDFVCPISQCKIPIKEEIFKSSFCVSDNDDQKPIIFSEETDEANEKVLPKESDNDDQKPIIFSEETDEANKKVLPKESVRCRRRGKIKLETFESLSLTTDDSNKNKKTKHLSDPEWKATKKCLFCRNFLSEGETFKLSCKHTYHLSCLIKSSNEARAALKEHTCPLKFCKRSIPYLYGNVEE